MSKRRKSTFKKLKPSKVVIGVSGRTGLPYGRVEWKKTRRKR